MTWIDQSVRGFTGDAAGAGSATPPGKRSLTAALTGLPVQRAVAGDGAPAERRGGAMDADDPFGLHLGDTGGSDRLPAATSAQMGTAFGADFSTVTVHEDGAAQAMGARAFARGEELHFAPGAYDPSSRAGQELIGHELTHVVQQRAGRVATPQGKDAPINADPGLEAEADDLGARAARGESVAAAIAGGRNPAPSPVVQRFVDPTTQATVTLDQIALMSRDDVTRYLGLISTKAIRPSVPEVRALHRRRLHLARTDEAQLLGEGVVGSMAEANQGGGLNYLHNVPDETVESLSNDGHDPSNGYANPDHFDRTSRFTWVLRANVSATAAIRGFIAPDDNPTIAECQTALQAAYYLTLLNAVGHAKFDARLGRADEVTPIAQRLRLQLDLKSDNPLQLLLADFTLGFNLQERGEALELEDEAQTLCSTENFRPVTLGGWYYMKNHEFYSRRHQGIWGGENAIYAGRNDQGEQVFSGFGLANKTEREMAQFLADTCNAAPTDERSGYMIQRAEFGLALPTLGDIASADGIHLAPESIDLINRKAGLGDPARLEANQAHDAEEQAHVRLRHLLAAIELPQPVTPDDIIRNVAFDHEGMGVDDQPAMLSSRDVTATWAETLSPTDAACVAVTLTKGAKDTVASVDHKVLMRLYCDHYHLDEGTCVLKGGLKRRFGDLNPDYAQVRLARGQSAVLYFPRPEEFERGHLSGAGFQSVGGKWLDADKIKQEFDVDELFVNETVVHDED